MRHLDLFTGIGGFHLAASWAGFETIGFSEIDSYCCALLAEKWPDIPNYGDIRTADFEPLRGRISVLSAGVPCQPSSLAGKRRGSGDDRWLWPATLAVVGLVKPTWCIFENPVGILTLDEFGGVLLRLESLGYQVRAFSVPANSVGAKHRRQRVFIVANAGRGEAPSFGSRVATDGSGDDAETMADAERRELQRRRERRDMGGEASEEYGKGNQRERPRNASGNSGEAMADAESEQASESREPWELRGFRFTEPPLCRRVDGIPNRSHRLKSLGNSVVPQQAYPFFEAIAKVESE